MSDQTSRDAYDRDGLDDGMFEQLTTDPDYRSAPHQTASQTASAGDRSRETRQRRARPAIRWSRFQAAGRGFDSRRAHFPKYLHA
jgi:hypothetical protein